MVSVSVEIGVRLVDVVNWAGLGREGNDVPEIAKKAARINIIARKPETIANYR
jgi:hypothetical protein